MKPTLHYDIRSVTAPGAEDETFYPAIVDRMEIVDLKDLLANAIDQNRIAGLKPVACASIADGMCEQMYKELEAGRSVRIGDYFTVRLYLDGQTNPSGTLSADENGINARFVKGADFALAPSEYELVYDDGGNKPHIRNVQGTTGQVLPGVIGRDGGIYIVGSRLTAPAGMGTVVLFRNLETGVVTETADITVENDCEIHMDRPAAIVAGGRYEIYVAFKEAGTSRTYPSNQRAVTVEPMPNPHEMNTIAQQGQEAGIITFDEDNKPVVTGVDLGDPTAVWIDVYPDGYDAGADLDYRLDDRSLDQIAATATTITFQLFDNQTRHAARDFKGKLARVWASYADGFKSYVNCQFKA